MRPHAVLTEHAVHNIKRSVWDGMLHKDVAVIFKISTSYVSQIVNGSAYPMIPWPDQRVGPMSHTRRMEIRQERIDRHGSPKEPVHDPELLATYYQVEREMQQEEDEKLLRAIKGLPPLEKEKTDDSG